MRLAQHFCRRTAALAHISHHSSPLRWSSVQMERAEVTEEDLIDVARRNVHMILSKSMKLRYDEKVVILAQAHTPLAKALSRAYRETTITAKPFIRYLDFDLASAEDIADELSFLREGDLVVTVQDEENTFKMTNNYRLRANLFQKGVKNIEHKFLSDVKPRNYTVYLDSLGFDPDVEGPIARGIKERLDNAKEIVVECYNCDEPLVYRGPMEKALLNLGDYSHLRNIGGTFPVGEVISELEDLTNVNGKAAVFSFADLNKQLCMPAMPFTITIKGGILTDYDAQAPQEFIELIAAIRAEEEVVWVREFGLGLNGAMSKTRIVDNITTYERQRGLHLSLGKKHNVFKGRSKSRWHADLFIDIDTMNIDGQLAFADGKFVL